MTNRHSVMVLGYHHVHALQILAELSRDLDVIVIAVSKGPNQPVVQSKYCDIPIVIESEIEEEFRSKLRQEIRQLKPDVVIPVGYESVLDLDAIRADICEYTEYCLPSTESLHTALDKSKTAEVAQSLGIEVPREFLQFRRRELDEARNEVEDLSFPVFLKAKQESGRNILARVESSNDFESTAEDLLSLDQFEGEEILVQEYVPGDGHTYGCGFLFDDGEPVVRFGQKELRSIPREGGTGTRVSIYRDDQLEEQSIRLLKALEWDGIALVEYRKRPDGTYSLMEINPKIWASYSLASRNGYRFSSELVSTVLDIDRRVTPQNQEGQMVFPLREVYYTLKHSDEESILNAARSLLFPPAPMDILIRDLRAWICPAGISTSIKWAIDLWCNEEDPFE